MDYEIVELAEKVVVGVRAVVDDDPEMGALREAWGRLMEGGVYAAIRNRRGAEAIGLYTDYSERGCTFLCGAEVSVNENPELDAITIPTGRFARFVIEDAEERMDDAVAAFWAESLAGYPELDRRFDLDFEEYVDRTKAYICIAVK
jgi:predicted transcriptional regulator YdeE